MAKSRLSLILSISFSIILVAGIIVFAILQTSTKPDLPNPDTIKVYNKSLTESKTISKGTEEYNEIMDRYSLMFEKTYLNQLSDGEVLSGKIVEDLNAEVWTDNNKLNGMYLEFTYTTTKKFIIYRGDSSRRVDIKSLIIPISSSDEVLKAYIYYTVDNSSNSSDKNKQPAEPCYPLVIEANTREMYSYLKSII